MRDAEDQLCYKPNQEPGFRPDVRWDLAAIRERLEEVMAAFDMLCEAAGQEPPFELAFRIIDAPRLVQYELRDRLDGLPRPKGEVQQARDPITPRMFPFFLLCFALSLIGEEP